MKRVPVPTVFLYVQSLKTKFVFLIIIMKIFTSECSGFAINLPILHNVNDNSQLPNG